MTRSLPLLGAVLVLWATLAAAVAAEPAVAVSAVEGRQGGAKALKSMENALKTLGLRVESNKALLAEARAQGGGKDVATDTAMLSAAARILQVDAVVYADLQPAQGRSKKDVDLLLTVYNGADGRVLGEHTVEIPRGRLTPKVWQIAAEAIEPDVRRGSHRPAVAAAPPPPVDPTPPPATEAPRADDRVEPREDDGSRPDLLRVEAGFAFLSRAFTYDVAPGSTITEGISYDSSMAPGVALAAEIYPLVAVTESFARNFGLAVRFEKVFLSTKQKVSDTGQETDLETSHSHLALGLRYRHRFWDDDASPELTGLAGIGFLSFELEDNQFYRGNAYTYFDVGLGAYVPFGTPILAAEIELRYLPSADTGDTAEELGGSAETTGYGIFAGLGSRIGEHFTASAGVDYTVMNSEIAGEGRGGRRGESAEDAFLGIRVLGGYRF